MALLACHIKHLYLLLVLSCCWFPVCVEWPDARVHLQLNFYLSPSQPAISPTYLLAWWMAQLWMKDGWSCTSMDTGALFVTTPLITLMLGWYAGSWDTLASPFHLATFFELSGVVIVPHPELECIYRVLIPHAYLRSILCSPVSTRASLHMPISFVYIFELLTILIQE